MKALISKMIFVLLIIMLLVFPTSNEAAAYDSDGGFQFGTTIYANGPQVNYALRMLKESSFDWVAVELSWADMQPTPDQKVNLNDFSAIYNSLQNTQQNLFIRLVNPPQWALTANGPDINATLTFISNILLNYPQIQAIELFPGVNISSDQSTLISPDHYINMLHQITNYLAQNQSPTQIIAGGFMQISSRTNGQSILDLSYLQSMYDLGLKNLPVIISMQFANTEIDPETPATDPNANLLRHYELIRQVMVNNQDYAKSLWITQLLPPEFSDQSNVQEAQAEWLSKSISQIRSQLYIQVCMLQPINPKNTNYSSGLSLISTSGDINPIVEATPFYTHHFLSENQNSVLKSNKNTQAILKKR